MARQQQQRQQQPGPRAARPARQQALPPQPAQGSLALEPAPEQVLEEAERIRLSRSYWRQRYRSLEALLADPQRAHVLLTCARGALRAQLRKQQR